MQKTDFIVLSGLNAEQVILELNAQNHFLELLETQIHVFSASKQMKRMRG